MITFKTFLLETDANRQPVFENTADQLVNASFHQGASIIADSFIDKTALFNFTRDMVRTSGCSDISVKRNEYGRALQLVFIKMKPMDKWSLSMLQKTFYARAKKFFNNDVTIGDMYFYDYSGDAVTYISLKSLIDNMTDTAIQDFRTLSLRVDLHNFQS